MQISNHSSQEPSRPLIQDKFAYDSLHHQDSEKNRDQFISLVTHDLKNPLAAIAMAVEVIKSESNDQFLLNEMLAVIERNLQYADHLLQNLLDASLITSGARPHLSYTKVCPKKEIMDLARIYQSKGEVRIKFHEPESDIPCFWDVSGIRRAIDNLLSNAFKYGDISQPVTIACWQNSELTTICVHNYGAPIPQKDQSSIFEGRFRTDCARHSGKKGWGLGLKLVKGIAEAHGGRVTVHSSEEEGTSFVITLPNDPRQR